MPAVEAFGRRWACGSDDFVFPGVLDATVKSYWLASALYYYTFASASGENGVLPWEYPIYFYCMMTSLAIIVLTDLILIRRSAKGSIMDSDLRKMVVPLIYTRLFLEGLDTGWNAVGTYWIFGGTFSLVQLENPAAFSFIRRYIICNWISVLVLVLYFAFLYDPLGGIRDKRSEGYTSAQAKFWTAKARTYCSVFGGSNGGEHSIFEEVGQLVTSILDRPEYISSDTIAGLFTLFRIDEDSFANQQNTVWSEKNCVVPTAVKMESCSDVQLLATENNFKNEISKQHKWIPIARHWEQLFLPANGIRRVFNCKCCKQIPPIQEVCNVDVIHVSRSDNFEMPFCLFVHHQSGTVVLSVTGQVTIYSMLIMANASPIQLSSSFILPGSEGTESKVHVGFFKSALKIRQKLKENGLLQKISETCTNSGYKFIIYGEGVGGGVAAMLGITVISEFPDVAVICFNPPGGLFCENIRKWTGKFVTSYIFENDAFAYLNRATVDALKGDIIKITHQILTPKYKLLLGVFLRLFGCKLKIQLKASGNLVPEKACYTNEAYTMTLPEEGENQNLPEIAADSESPEPTHSDITNNTRQMESTPLYLPGMLIIISQNEPVTDKEQKYGIEFGNPEKFTELKLWMRHNRVHGDKIQEAFLEYASVHSSV